MNGRTRLFTAESDRIYKLFCKLLPEYQGRGLSEKMARSGAINEVVAKTGYSQPTVRKHIKIHES